MFELYFLIFAQKTTL